MKARCSAYPESDRVPRRMLYLSSLSRGPPNLMYEVASTSRKVGLVMLSKFAIIASMSSLVAKRDLPNLPI